VLNQKTGWFDSHPSTASRIAAARRLNAPGLVHDERPAASLFRDFEHRCKAVTLGYYRAALGERMQASNLVPTESMVQQAEAVDQVFDVVTRFAPGETLTLEAMIWPLPERLSEAHAAESPERRLRELRSALPARAAEARAAAEAVAPLAERETRLERALAAIDAGIKVRPKHVDLKSAKRPAVREALDAVRAELAEARRPIERCHGQIARRVAVGLALLDTPQLTARLANAEKLIRRRDRFLDRLDALHRVHRLVVKLQSQTLKLETLLHHLKRMKHDPSFVEHVLGVTKNLHDQLFDLTRRLQEAAYPFPHQERGVSIGRYLTPELPPAKAVGEVYEVALETIDRYRRLYYRLLASVMQMSEAAEKAVGLEPLKPMKDGEREEQQTAPVSA
jgi:hypothetical protein